MNQHQQILELSQQVHAAKLRSKERSPTAPKADPVPRKAAASPP